MVVTSSDRSDPQRDVPARDLGGAEALDDAGVFSDADYDAYQGAVWDRNCAVGKLRYERGDLEAARDGLSAEARDAEERGALSEADGYRAAVGEIDQDLERIAERLALIETAEWLDAAIAANAGLNEFNAAAFSQAAELSAQRVSCAAVGGTDHG